MTNSVSFQAQWIPKGDNELADYLSRTVDPDDWMLLPDLFKLITFKWGPFDVDGMACNFVNDFCCLPKSRDMFIPSRGSSFVYFNKRSVFSCMPKFNVLALRLDFSC
ncbi:unnamed protein product [Porites evermanni]|uniref:RNase H type-1 domain-containing protein n=1 Tax=Porites evermanni TaxID=104178 RepID=A0ABN8S318_9CNID|nr:unnamed protein product [Porites evermanni]